MNRKRRSDVIVNTSLWLLLFVVIALVVFVTQRAEAMTLTGTETGLSRLADDVLLSADALGPVAIIGGLALLGLGIAFSYNLPAIGHAVVAGSILTLGGTTVATVMGADLAMLYRSCAVVAEEAGDQERAKLFRDALRAVGASQAGQTMKIQLGACGGLVGNATIAITSARQQEQ